MRKEKGITLVALIITIAVMIILAGVSINVTSDMQEQMKFQAFKTQLDILQTEVINNYENANIATEEMKANNEFITYTPEELEAKGFTKPDQDAYINWSTRQVKMIYKGQEYFSEKYNVESNVSNESNTNFDIDISYQENRYNVKVQPEENMAGIEVAYRIKAEEGQEESSWILAGGYEFEYVQYGNYEVRLKDKKGNETIKTIKQKLETITSDGERAILNGTLGEKLVNYKIYGKTVNSQSVGDNGKFNVVSKNTEIETDYTINVDSALRSNDSVVDNIEYLTQKITRNINSDGTQLSTSTEENANVPDIYTKDGVTEIYAEDETIGLTKAEFTYIKTEIE